MHEIDEFLKKNRVTEIEAIIPDMAGIARGKIIPRSKFESGESMRLPQAVMIQTVTGDYPEDGTLTGVTDPDMVCVPDASTIRMIPWAIDPTAQVIHDCVHFDGTPVAHLAAPRCCAACSNSMRPKAGSRSSRPNWSSTWST